MNKTIQQISIGILGGGQLGRMLIQSAINLNLNISILDPDKNAPSRHLVKKFTLGDLNDYDTVYDFGKDKDLITIEIENVNVEALKTLEKEGKKVYPQPHIIELIQDKGSQKMFYQRNDIPSPDFFLVENKLQISKYANYFPFFQKLRKGGYDGKGVVKLVNPHHIEKAFDEPSVLERLVDFDKELSVIVARSESGEIKCFPVVECEFNPEANLVEYLFSPANIKKNIEKDAIKLATEVAEKLGIIGLLAVELFLTKEGKLLVNEIAPRTHNSGHQTIEGNITSQFEQQWRAILNLPLGDTSIIKASVMVNLLGDFGYSGTAIYQGLEDILKFSGVYIHLYGKTNTRPFRKMGHATIVDEDILKAKQKAKIVKNTLKIIA
ncbi:MAG: 5-(carboxyamino)imidazole ribonucleotide synthase [Bacteroidota bacterium]|nr:5-(carboxyamino)imidazole ribonucleotide synthase [Bacteroidota bacterium]MDP3145870.1 5-(carboxyamino)imidazole ribonucleotide synthase [Bacteroidota bacterium]